MYSSINLEMTEVNALVERFRARTDLLPPKARGLRRLTAELKAISEIGLPWKTVWRILRDAGYQGTYRQFVAMANRLTGKPGRSRTKPQNLPAPPQKDDHSPPLYLTRIEAQGRIQSPNGRSEEKRKWRGWIVRRKRTGQERRGSIDRRYSFRRRSRAGVGND
jgi:hypothetical protein